MAPEVAALVLAAGARVDAMLCTGVEVKYEGETGATELDGMIAAEVVVGTITAVVDVDVGATMTDVDVVGIAWGVVEVCTGGATVVVGIATGTLVVGAAAAVVAGDPVLPPSTSAGHSLPPDEKLVSPAKYEHAPATLYKQLRVFWSPGAALVRVPPPLSDDGHPKARR